MVWVTSKGSRKRSTRFWLVQESVNKKSMVTKTDNKYRSTRELLALTQQIPASPCLPVRCLATSLGREILSS